MTAELSDLSHKRILWMQIIGALGSMLLMFMAGTMGGWTSPYLAKLTAEDSPLPITLDEASWVASLLNMGRLVGAVPAAASLYYFGSKKTLLFTGIPLILNWVSFIAANSVWWLYLGRLVGGVAMVFTYSSFPLYLGEISSPAIRGALVTAASLGTAVGTVFGNVVGAYVSLKVFGYICLVPSVVAILIFMWIPESPHYLIGIGKVEEARKAITRYNPNADVKVEAKSIEDFVNASKSISLGDKLREFNVPANRKAGLIIISIHMFIQFSGGNNMIFYMEIILTNAGLTVIEPSTMVIITGMCGILAGLSSIYLTEKVGRKMLWTVSACGITVMLIILGTHSAFLAGGTDPANLQWLVIPVIIIWEIFFFGGSYSIPSTVLSELFAPNIKSIAAFIASIALGGFAFISSRTYQPLLDATSQSVVFCAYAVVSLLAVVFGLTVLPETKGKSLQEIQNTLHKKNPA